MTKFEEEVKRPDNGPITELNNNMQSVFSQYRKMRQYADYVEYKAARYQDNAINESKLRCKEKAKHDAEISELERENQRLKSQLQQQALPVVPECVWKILIKYKGSNQSVYGLLKALELSKGTDIYNWIFSEGNQDIFALAFITGKYEVEKPQLFYLKNKLTTSYLALDTNTGYYEHWGEEIIPKLLNKQGYKSSFTQQEIDSMETGSYEQIEVME